MGITNLVHTLEVGLKLAVLLFGRQLVDLEPEAAVSSLKSETLVVPAPFLRACGGLTPLALPTMDNLSDIPAAL